jgi:hypothetical protein
MGADQRVAPEYSLVMATGKRWAEGPIAPLTINIVQLLLDEGQKAGQGAHQRSRAGGPCDTVGSDLGKQSRLPERWERTMSIRTAQCWYGGWPAKEQQRRDRGHEVTG